MLAETDASGNTLGEYVYFDGSRIARWDASGNVYYYFPDALGSLGLATDQTGAPVEGMLHYPFGQEWQNSAGFGWDEKFAQLQTHDVDLSLYMTTSRLYKAGIGRWMTPDKLGGDVTNPQSLNRYAYVLNNPATLNDPLGLDPYICPQGAYCITVTASPPEPVVLLAGLLGAGPLLSGGVRGGALRITNPSQSGSQQKTIGSVLSRLLAALACDSDCTSFLAGKGLDPVQTLEDIIRFDLSGHADISVGGNPYRISAVSGGWRRHCS